MNQEFEKKSEKARDNAKLAIAEIVLGALSTTTGVAYGCAYFFEAPGPSNAYLILGYCGIFAGASMLSDGIRRTYKTTKSLCDILDSVEREK